jgi:ATP-dependent DNA ligase
VSHVQFIPPAPPTLTASAPTGEGWLYEQKVDGWRSQLHKDGASSAIFGKNGGDLTLRFPGIAAAVLWLTTRSCIIDGELAPPIVTGSRISWACCTADMHRRAFMPSICWS